MNISCKLVVFLGLLTLFIVCSGEFRLAAAAYARLATMFIAGAVCAVFVEGLPFVDP